MTTTLEDRLSCVSATWNPTQRLHVGNVAWAWCGGDGAPVPDQTLAWGDPLTAFADLWPDVAGPAEASLHVSPVASRHQHGHVVTDLLALAPALTLEVSRQDHPLVRALEDAGLREARERPWFAQLWRDIRDLSDIDQISAPDGFLLRGVDPYSSADVRERTDVHRRSWAPSRIKTLLGQSVTGSEAQSSYSLATQEAVMGTAIYRPELDLIAATGTGQAVAYALGWFDETNRSVLLEPVGTDPGYSRRGLARAACAALLRAARDLGATQAVVSPRGDAAYPVPRRLYEQLGMREVAQFVELTNVAD